uniref:Uncharacterized mitochondrial protein AtMg00810-like n=1 Tax=Tanacetum cinerariifolium TaxID=118510 RepID=A0A6L2M678_TANCI|nr:uncharacterized mitochondrial protein AtMg00810-like [Tanacetum cinerariifolium]
MVERSEDFPLPVEVPTARRKFSLLKKSDDTAERIALLSEDKGLASYETGKKTWKKISIQGTDVAGFDKSKVECFNCHKMSHFTRECRAPRSQDRGRRDNYRQGSKVEEQALKALMAIDGTRTRRELGYSVVPPPPAQVYSPPKKDMSWTGLPEFVDDTITDYSRPSPTVKSAKFVMKKKACFNCGEFDHLTYDCCKWVKKGTSRPQNNIHKRKFPTGSTKFSTADMGKKGNAVKASASQNNIDDKGYWDSGCSRHMTGNISYLSNYGPFNRGYVSFGQGGCKITGKGTIKTGKLEFENVYFVKDLKNFKLLDDSNVLLKTPRQHNTYSINLNNIVSHKDLTCLVAKASADELTDDFSRFTWTFFLKTKDETSGILRKFITEIENLKDLKVKIIRTPQQNGVAEKRNMTLIEAARTMLADAKLPVTFWAEAVNTACYVQNTVLVNNPQNKTPYELFNGRTPAIGFLKPFGCHVMILNTFDNLEKFEAKGDEGYFIRYSMSSKAFRVFNKRTKRVEENLHVDFLENKAIEKGAGPNWLFDIDSLTKSMNYVPVVVAGTNSTNFSGTKDAASQEVKKDVSSLRKIALPNWVHDALLESSSSKPQDDCSTDVFESSGNSNPTATSTNPSVDQMETLTVETSIPTIKTPSLDNILTLINRFEDILGVTTNSNESNGVEADVSNMETTITASPTPTLRIHKDHSKSQIISHVDTPIQTRHKSKEPCREFEAFMHERFQMSAMGELNFFLGLQVLQKEDGIFLSQDKYVGDILKKFGYSDVRSANTPMDKENPWGKDGSGKDVDLHLYRSMIGSLMYLIASRPDIMFAVCACARHQVTSKECHLHAIKKIFRYLKGHPKLGLWYPKESPFDLVAYSDSDYGVATQDRKSTT